MIEYKRVVTGSNYILFLLNNGWEIISCNKSITYMKRVTANNE